MRKRFFTILTMIIIVYSAQAQSVNIPDANFKNYLLGNTLINTDNNPSEISILEANTFNGTIDCSNMNISDLTGIQAFVNLERLVCDNNQLTILDVSNNLNLMELYCSRNQLTSLNVFSNLNLWVLYCSNNNLTNLDVSNNSNLLYLECHNNDLTGLDVSNNMQLEHFTCENNPNLNCVQVYDINKANANWVFKDPQTDYSVNCSSSSCNVTIPDANFKSYLVNNTAINTNGDTEIQCSEAIAFTGGIICPNSNISDLTGIEAFINIRVLNCSGNQLTGLNVSGNTSLVNLICGSNSLSVLDVSTNTLLRFLNCRDNQLTNLNVASNTILEQLNCQLNQLERLNVSMNTVLERLICNFNQLKNLNIANGNNSNFIFFNIRNNTLLSCIETDLSTVNSANPIWLNKDLQHNYSFTACPVIPVAPMHFRINNKVNVYPNPTKGMINIKTEGLQVLKTEVLDTSGRILKEINKKEENDISALKPGIYSIKIYLKTGSIIKRLIKE